MCSSAEATYHRRMADAARAAQGKLLRAELLAAADELRQIGARLAAVAENITDRQNEENPSTE